MNNYFLSSIFGVTAAIFTFIPNAATALERSEIAAIAKEFTVQIQGEETGTGTIIEQNGTTYTVLTAWHVVDTPGTYQVVTVDGEPHQVDRIQKLPNADTDLAIVEFTTENIYDIAELGASETIAEGIDIYVVGYPDPTSGIPERAYSFLPASILSRLSQGEEGYQLVHSNPSTPGSSGGAILDSEARLVGVNGKTRCDSNTGKCNGFAVPLELYLAAQNEFSVPTNVTAPQDFISVGNRLLKQGNYQGAVAQFTQAIASNSSDLDAYHGRAEAYYWLKDYQAVILNFDKILQLHPDDVLAYRRRGTAYSSLKEYEKAIADYNEAIRLDPEDTYAYNNRGIAYRNLNEYEKAIADFNEAIRLDPELAVPYNNRGLAYNDLKEYEKAIADFNEAIRLNPDDGDAYYNRGLAYRYLIADYNEAIRLNPDDAVAYYNRGNVYRNLKEYENAIADYNEAIRLNPDDADAYFYRGNAYSDLKEYEKAIADYSEAIRLDPDDAPAYNNRGFAYYGLKEHENATVDYNVAIRLEPELAYVPYSNLGFIEYEFGNLNKAKNYWQQALEIEPDFAETNLALAVLLYQQGEQEQAVNMAQKALESDKQWGNLDYLREQLWSDPLIEDTEKLFNDERLQPYF
ncbi:MAG: hypothetical protein Tsb0014_30810 [Pleurocapsa sp.]